jgi:hypothetical protein
MDERRGEGKFEYAGDDRASQVEALGFVRRDALENGGVDWVIYIYGYIV